MREKGHIFGVPDVFSPNERSAKRNAKPKLRKLLAMLLVFVLTFGSMPAIGPRAYAVDAAETLNWLTMEDNGDGTATIKSFNYIANTSPNEITIPKTWTPNGSSTPLTITKIADDAFSGAGLKKVDFEPLTDEEIAAGNGLQVIGANAFKSCLFTNIDLPLTVTNIGDSAFFACSNLEAIDLSGLKNLTVIGESAFELCKSASSIVLPEGLKEIGKNAFRSVMLATYVKVPSSVTTIRRLASVFTGEDKGSVPGMVVDLQDFEPGAFLNTTPDIFAGTRYVDFKWGSVNSNMSDDSTCLLINTRTGLICGFKENASSYPDWNGGEIIIKKSYSDGNGGTVEVKGFTDGAFANFRGWAYGAKSLTIEEDVAITAIANGAFAFSSFSTFDLPDTITTIGANAFYYAVKLSGEFKIPADVTARPATICENPYK